MHELIVKLVYDEMNIYRCIKKSIAVQMSYGEKKKFQIASFVKYVDSSQSAKLLNKR